MLAHPVDQDDGGLRILGDEPEMGDDGGETGAVAEARALLQRLDAYLPMGGRDQAERLGS